MRLTWGTVTSTAPLLVRPDWDDNTVPGQPATATLTPVSIGERVYVAYAGKQFVILGKPA